MRVSTPRDLGLLVRERRHELRLSQEVLAERAGVGRSWLVAVEQGHPRAELGKLLALLAELDLDVDLSPDAEVSGEPRDRPATVDLDELLDRHDARSRSAR